MSDGKKSETPESFAGYPESVAEIVSERSGRAALWKPRDLLINLLRAIDEGTLEADAMVVFYAKVKEDGVVHPGYSVASPDAITTMGTVSIGQNAMIRDMTD